MSVSGFESVQSFGLAQNIHAMVDLDLAASPVKFSLSTAPYLIMAEILSAHQVLLYPSSGEVRSQPTGQVLLAERNFVLVGQVDILYYSRLVRLRRKLPNSDPFFSRWVSTLGTHAV